jgi:PGF-CTERM protein
MKSPVSTSVVAVGVASLLLLAAVGTGGAAVQGDGEGYVVETSDGGEFCLSPVEGTENVSQFYGYRSDSSDSRGGETGFEEARTASLFLYRSAQTGNLSLVFLHGSANESELRRADYSLSGFEGASWVVQDDPGSFAYDSYEFDGDAITGVNWRWESGTDGGAIAPLGDEFDVSITATTQEVETWRVIDGNGSAAGTAPVGGSVQIRTATGEECTETTETSGSDGPGFGVVAALLGLAGAAAARRVRR